MTSTVADKTAAVLEMEPDWELARALLGGTRAMRKAGKAHLPQWPNEDHDAYACRLATAVLFPAYQRTVQTLTGKPFSKPITMGEDVPPQLQEWAQDIDLQGRNLDAFAADAMESALGYGIAGILVDYPTKPEEVRTAADERAAGLRPYWIEIKPWQVLGWIAERVNGAWRLRQLRLMECADEPDGEYGVKSVDQVRVLEPGKWRTERQNEKKEWVKYEEGITTLSYIPYVPVYGGRTGFMTGKPPLIEVAHLNVAHWQSASDQQTILHVARVPILTVIGIDDDKWSMTVGASAAVKLPQGGDMKFVEHSGAAIAAGATELDALEERMRQAGAELLVIAPGKITATQVQTENAVGMCALQRITQGLEDALDQALQTTADWVGEKQGGHVTLFNDYGAASLQEASADLLLKSNQAGKLSDETYHSELQRRGILSADIDWQAEKDRLDEQGPALGMMGAVDPLTGEPVQPEIDPLTGEPKPAAAGAPSASAEPVSAAPAQDLGPLVDAIQALASKPAPEAVAAAPIDFTPLADAIKGQQSNISMEMDVTPLADAIREGFKSVPAPVVNVPEQDMSAVVASMSSMFLEAVKNMPAPVIEVAAPDAPQVTFTPPEAKKGRVKFIEDAEGKIVGAEIE